MSVVVEKSADASAIRPFTIETPEADLDGLRPAHRGDAVAGEGDRPG